MTTKEFTEQVKVGDKVVLRNDLKHDHVYGGESYILPTSATPWGMVKPGSVVTVSEIILRGEKEEQHPEFFVNDDTEWFYTPEMVDHVVCKSKKNNATKHVDCGMNKQEFFRNVRAGDTVILRSDLKNGEYYEDELYISSMFAPGSKATVSTIEKCKDGKIFVFLKEDPECYRYTPAMFKTAISSDYSERERVVNLWIEKVGLEKALKLVDEKLTPGDVIKISERVVLSNFSIKFWGCYYWEEYMLAAGRTAKIVSIRHDSASGKGRRYSLDKERREYYYSVPMFDIAYTGSRNEHIFEFIDADLKTGTRVKKESVEILKNDTTEKDDKVLGYFQKKLADLTYEVEMVEFIIKRLSKDE